MSSANQESRTFVSHLECSKTGTRLPGDVLHTLSPAGAPLLVRYRLDDLRKALTPDAFHQRAPDFWRYRELLPVKKRSDIVSLGETMTPLVPLRALHGAHVLVKDEGRLPTGSFKARGLAVAVSMAKAMGVQKVAMPTNGNAGAALAAYGRRAGMEVIVFCPRDTPEINIAETIAHGATVHRIDGFINDCGKLVSEGQSRAGWFDMSTLKEPYRIEGKKTMGLELAEQLGWRLPDVIFYPTGGGTGLIGMWKAFAELGELGWIGSSRPRMVAVQARGCAPIVKAYELGAEHAEPWENSHTIAAGIRVPEARGDFLILRALRESGGFAIAVDDADIEAAGKEVAHAEGLLMCPESAATYAAYKQSLRAGLVDRDEQVVLFNCATGLKYPLPLDPR